MTDEVIIALDYHESDNNIPIFIWTEYGVKFVFLKDDVKKLKRPYDFIINLIPSVTIHSDIYDELTFGFGGRIEFDDIIDLLLIQLEIGYNEHNISTAVPLKNQWGLSFKGQLGF